MPLQTNLIEYSAHATEVKEWFYYAEGGEGEQRSKADRQEGQRMGPVSKDELKTLFYKGKVGCPQALDSLLRLLLFASISNRSIMDFMR